MRTMKKRELTPEQAYAVQQAVATLRIEDMKPSAEDIEDAVSVVTGEKTADEIIKAYLKDLKNER